MTTSLYPTLTDHQRVMQRLAATGRRYEVQVYGGGSFISDRGRLHKKRRNALGVLEQSRRARTTMFRFDAKGVFIGTNRPLKAWWLTRGLGLGR